MRCGANDAYRIKFAAGEREEKSSDEISCIRKQICRNVAETEMGVRKAGTGSRIETSVKCMRLQIACQKAVSAPQKYETCTPSSLQVSST